MIPADEQFLGSQLLQTLTGIIQFNLRANQTERSFNGSNKGGYGARKRRKKMRAEAARQRLTPQAPTPPPSTQPCRRCQLRCTCLEPPSPPPPPALTTSNNGSDLVTGTDQLIFSQIRNMDQLLSDGLGIQADNQVNINNVVAKVRELIKENNDMRNFFKKFYGKIQPSKICANQHNSVATQTPPMARPRPGKHTGHARSGAQDSVIKASQTLDHHFPVAEQHDVWSANSGGRGASKRPGHDPTVKHEASEPIAKVSKLQEQVLSEKFHSEFCEKDWYWNELPVQKAYELMQQFAFPGHYIVLQCDTFIFRIIWKAGDDNIRSRPCSLWDFIKENTFDDATWNHTVQSVVRESTDVSFFATPLPGKETYRKISQKRHFSNLKKMTFCGWCQQYQDTPHYCFEVQDWLHIDQNNLLFIRGKTRIEASRTDFYNESGARARTFPNRNNMLLQLYREAEDYWAKKEKTNRQNWLNDQRKILLKKSPKEWNSYIDQELTQYVRKNNVQQSDVINWISGKEELLQELRQNEKNKEEERKRKEEMEKIEKMKKMEQMEKRTKWNDPPPEFWKSVENFDRCRSGLYHMRQYDTDSDDDND